MHQYATASGGTTPAELSELENVLSEFAKYYILPMNRQREIAFGFMEFKAVLSHKDKVNSFERACIHTESGISLSPYVGAYVEALGYLGAM